MKILTFAPTQTQLRMLESAGEVGNLCAAFHIQGHLDIHRLERAIKAVISQCAPLAFRYVRTQDSQQILVSAEKTQTLHVHDSSQEDSNWRFSMLQDLCQRPFRADGGAPFQFTLLQRSLEDFELVFACHPAILDSFSLKPLFEAISNSYNSEAHTFPELGLDQEALVAEERDLLQSARFQESIRFWLHLLQSTNYEWKPPRLETETAQHTEVVKASAQVQSKIKSLAEKLGLPVGDLLLLCAHALISRLTQNDLVVTSFHQRIATKASGNIGFHENKLALKSLVDRELSFRQFIHQSKRLMGQIRFHGNIPARSLSNELLRIEPDFKRITNLLFEADPLPYDALHLQGTNVTLMPQFSRRNEQEDFAIHFDLRDDLVFHLSSSSPQELTSLRQFMQTYLVMLDNLDENLETSIQRLPILNHEMRRRLLEFSTGPHLGHKPEDFSLHFERIARELPTLPALTWQDRTWSYRDLYQVILRIAGHLRTKLHVDGTDTLIAICLPRSDKMIQTILGVYGAGATYVPLDPQMPVDRMKMILRDSRAKAVIVDESTQSLFQDVPTEKLSIHELLQNEPAKPLTQLPVLPGHCGAYVIYTSGTTGEPKGCLIERHNLAILIASLGTRWQRNRYARWLQFAAFTFDASVVDIFFPLSGGAEVIMTPSEIRADPDEVYRLMQAAQITNCDLPPALLALLPRKPLPDLKMIMCGGESLDEEAARFWSKTTELNNCYGPTEATVMATINILNGAKSAANLGRPMHGYYVFLLDDDNELVPIGGVGEIVIGGEAVSRGYWDRPKLNQQKFLPNPYSDGRIYKTGDLGRFLPNGEIEFLGRKDFQVKIRGFRIELGEIESAIADQPEVRGVHVGVQTIAGSKSIVAWYIGPHLSVDQLRQRLALRLPHYMVPSYFVPIDSFPLTINGKIDRQRLPAPQSLMTSEQADEMDRLQTQMQKIWAGVLKLPQESVQLRSHFFHLGGHSLAAALVCNQWNAATRSSVRVKALFERPLFADFCEWVRHLPADDESRPILRDLGVTEAPVDSRLIGLIYSRATSHPNDNMYNVVTRMDFTREVDPQRLQVALSDLLAKNPLFRSAFEERQGRIWIAEDPTAARPKISVKKRAIAEIEKISEELRKKPLGVHKAPLWRAEIAQRPDGSIALIMCVHHALFDGWSLNLFTEELLNRYANPGAQLPPRLNWFDYNIWAQYLPKSRAFQNSIVYWRNKLTDIQGRVDLPVQATAKIPDANLYLSMKIDAAKVEKLKAFADELNITLPPLLFAIYLVWIWRISNQEQIVCAYPYAGRDEPGSENIYGTFVTMGFLSQKVDPTQGFADLAQAVHQQMIDDKENLVAAPYDAEIASVDAINVIFSLQSGISLEGDVGNLHYHVEELPSSTSKGDIAGVFYQTPSGALEGRIEYDSSQLSSETMSSFLSSLSCLIDGVARQPQRRVGELEYLTPSHLNQILTSSVGPELKMNDTSIALRWSQTVAAHAELPALIYGNESWTYNQVDQWSGQIARSLLQSGQAGDRIGLSFQKGPAALASILGILRAGCCYVPIDSSYPADRILHFVRNTGVQQILCDEVSEKVLQQKASVELLKLKTKFLRPTLPGQNYPPFALPSVDPESLAYIIHTSGSTGLPKGVMIENRTVVRQAEASLNPMHYRAGARSSLIASLSFDTSVIEIFLTLLNGGALVIVPEDVRKDPILLHAELKKQKVTHAIVAPVMLQNLPREPLPQLEFIGFGGDVLDEATAQWWATRTRLFSLYGPTEVTVQSSVGEIKVGGSHRTIGLPLPGYRNYLLNPWHQPVPWGAVGEICVGGQGLARGYWSLDEMTQERFIADPFEDSPYALMYLTGDLGRFRSDGSIEFLSRNDGQLKVRGFRIELGEIESQLGLFPGIQQTVCTAKGTGDTKYLAAFYIANQVLDSNLLRKHLEKSLPDYMIPAFFVRLQALPMTPNGKVDRKALPEVARKVADRPPLPGLETTIAVVWEKVLRMTGINRDDHFFHIGGNSLLAVRLQSELRQTLDLRFSIAEFYENPTIAALASGFHSNALSQSLEDIRTIAQSWKNLTAPSRGTPPAKPVVLLTGARGFLGQFLLQELIPSSEKVVCLLRCQTAEEGWTQLGEAATKAGLLLNLDQMKSKVEIVSGDLSQPQLGLKPEVWTKLSTSIDSIVHCGAYVHHLHSYATLRATNILGTQELLRLASDRKLKAFAFVSTLAAAFAAQGAKAATESVPTTDPAIDNGYILSKYVGERLVADWSAHFNAPAWILRPGNVTGSSVSGYTNFEQNHFWHLVKSCLQMQHFPDWSAKVEMIPVDILTKAMALLALSSPEQLVGVANLRNPLELETRAFYQQLADLGWPNSPVPPKQWQQELLSADESNAMSKLRDLYQGDLSGSMPDVHQEKLLPLLQSRGVSLEIDLKTLLPKYLAYLEKSDFLSSLDKG